MRARPRQSGGSQRVLAYQKVTVPYFDLALYGLEDYNSEAAVPAVFRFHPYTLGAPQRLICQCCGMPLEDSILSREPDGSFNEEYCTWCYSGGKFTYTSKEQLIDFCVAHIASEDWPAQQVRAHMETVVPELKHWKK